MVVQMIVMCKQVCEIGVFLKVVKNILVLCVVEGIEFVVVQDKLVGLLLYVFLFEEFGVVGCLIKEVVKINDKFKVKVVLIGGEVFLVSYVDVLVLLLICDQVLVMLVCVLIELVMMFVCVIKVIGDKQNGGEIVDVVELVVEIV